MNYSVYIKSHSDMPDFEAEYSEEELKAGICQIPYVEDVPDYEDHIASVIATKCGGKLIDVPQGYKCVSCEQIYHLDEDHPNLEEDIEKAELLHDDYLLI